MNGHSDTISLFCRNHPIRIRPVPYFRGILCGFWKIWAPIFTIEIKKQVGNMVFYIEIWRSFFPKTAKNSAKIRGPVGLGSEISTVKWNRVRTSLHIPKYEYINCMTGMNGHFDTISLFCRNFRPASDRFLIFAEFFAVFGKTGRQIPI